MYNIVYILQSFSQRVSLSTELCESVGWSGFKEYVAYSCPRRRGSVHSGALDSVIKCCRHEIVT